MKMEDTFYANIYMGTIPGYTGDPANPDIVYNICQDYCNEVKLGVTITPITFTYVDGCEPGYIIGLINYPRFPSDRETIIFNAINLGLKLMLALEQERFSIVTPDKTIMMEKGDLLDNISSD